MGGISGLIMSWVNELNGHDSESMYLVFLSFGELIMMSSRASFYYCVL